MSNELPKVECSMCGRDGEPPASCGICHGSAHTQDRAFTLSDVRSGRVIEDARYGLEGNVGPKTSDPLWAGTEQH